jgi:hypothetical protein
MNQEQKDTIREELIKDFISDLKTMSDVISDDLWYINPENIKGYLRICAEHFTEKAYELGAKDKVEEVQICNGYTKIGGKIYKETDGELEHIIKSLKDNT